MKPGDIIAKGLKLADQFLHKDEEPLLQQKKVLNHLLKKAQRTDFGLHYNFSKLLESADTVLAFQTKVPIHDYQLIFERWWHRTLRGEPDVSWPGTVKYFALSSGTSNATSKRIPITQDMFSTLRRGAFDLFATFPAFQLSDKIYTKSWLGVGGTSHLEEVDGHFEGYLSGINAKKRPFWSRKYYKPGGEIATVADFKERTKLISKAAPNWDIGVIIGIPHWVQITLEQILAENQIKTILEIWPNLQLFVSGGTDFRPYRKSLDKLVGRPLTYLNTYMASEGFIGHQRIPESTDLHLLLNHGIFFEFIPFGEEYFDEDGNLIQTPPVYTIDQVKANVDYALLISTCAGTWRYLIGDTVRFTDPGTARFLISGRTKYYLNLCSEHLTGDNTNEAITKTEEELNIAIPEYTIAGMPSGDYFRHHWYIGSNDPIDKERLKSTLDRHLRQLNDDYNSERDTALGIEIEILPPEKFYQWQEQQGQGNGQSKIPRVMKGKMLKSWQSFLKTDL